MILRLARLAFFPIPALALVVGAVLGAVSISTAKLAGWLIGSFTRYCDSIQR